MNFIDSLKRDLTENGLFPNQVDDVLKRFMESEKSSDMHNRMRDDTGEYPSGLYNIVWKICKAITLEYILEVCPDAWFKPCFLPDSEQEAFLAECRATALEYAK